ncbi:MAG: SUMF1/EgtB/PvdO family nonheme iron enzyme [Bacteroidales bacterium]|nr:SUMF1/EgtB/PvdO family nonheme iron enzyme [Bacteroidales bacterium]
MSKKGFMLAAALVAAFTLRAQLVSADSLVVVDLPGGQRLEMVHVAGGDFTMGNNEARGLKVNYDASRPEHRVKVDDFYIARFEVTQAQWTAVMGENPSKAAGSDSLPVEQVSWVAAQQFCALLSQMSGHRFRLPTEAEWEYAARGGEYSHNTPFAGSGAIANVGWYCVNSEGHTHPVGRLKPNELGLYDMCGNVMEWCSDWMAPYGDGDAVNPEGPSSGESRVLRGGHYNSTSPGCTVYDRAWYLPTGSYEYFGLRLVMEPEKIEP